MKKLITALALLAACRSAAPGVASAPAPSGNQTGAADAAGAVRAFIDAAKEQDLQAISALFGDENGLARDRMPREELEKRELIMICWLKHDEYTLMGDAPSTGNSRTIAVSLSLGQLTRTTNFVASQIKSGRWLVKSFDPGSLQALCAQR